MINPDQLLKKINEKSHFSNCISNENLLDSILNILLSLVHHQDVSFYGEQTLFPNTVKVETYEVLMGQLEKSKTYLFFQTSGTTGAPKLIKRRFQSLKNGIRVSPSLMDKTWGFCYSTRHISGFLVMLQAALTRSKLIDLRNLGSKDLEQTLIEHQVTHLSAPATFYKLHFPLGRQIDSVKSVANGGEPLDTYLLHHLQQSCPKAQIRNIYASTELGSLLVSKSDIFCIPDHLKDKIKIQDQRIWVARDLLDDYQMEEGGWYDTQDKVDLLEDGRFRITGRISDEVKVLGHLVSLRKVEHIITNFEPVKLARVMASPHKVFGHLLRCEVVLKEKYSLSQKDFSAFLTEKLRDYERPLKIRFVETIPMTQSGKVKR